MRNLVLKNETFFSILSGNEEEIKRFVTIVKTLKNLSYQVILSDQLLMEIFDKIHALRKNEDIKILNRNIEKMFTFSEVSEHTALIHRLDNLVKEECLFFKDILMNGEFFDPNVNYIGYMLDIENGMRNISQIEELKQVLLLFCQKNNDINEFIKEVKVILPHIEFDEEIEKSIEELNDGFEARKNEIIYHLYCIQNEIPKIIERNISGYQNIGNAMTISCSPERDRDTVKNKLTKQVNGIDVNCELHTKMNRLSTHAPDRIYFCPSIPAGIDTEREGKILIYKITKHA